MSRLSDGLLSGKHHREGDTDKGNCRVAFDFPPVNKDHAFDCIDVMRGIADKRKVSVAHIALAWLLHRPVVASVIIGVKCLDQPDDNIAAAKLELDHDELAALDKISALPDAYPTWMLDRQGECWRNQVTSSRKC